ncbi:putative cyclin [Rosa chinensis]|uniref:B-like cyclin n=1 Tax=Rosa chinensis TaxID=74649 RepID=A0A2P6PHQ1_ROSCH|nr:G2/mitotic-specific cyclin S13-7 [Rosa chinensis]PRQ21446.1 putative cyclin [Rosa chinensis]
MDTRGDGEVNGEVPRRNQRVALQDRTNVEAAQLLANAQKNNVNPVLVPSLQDKVAVNRKCAPANKGTKKKPIDEDVVVISSDEEEEKPVLLPCLQDKVALNRKYAPEKKGTKKKPIDEDVVGVSSDEEEEKPVSNRSKPSQGSRKEVKTLTSILTARSEAMAGGATNKPKEQVVDFDSADFNDELAVVEYVDDMYKFYKLEEDGNRVGDYLDSQPEVNSKMRSILIDWIIEVHRKFELMPETFYLTVNIIDRYLSVRIVPRRELQLLGISSMVIASKYEEVWAPQVNDFVCISDDAYMEDEIRKMEKEILGKLEWYLTVPTPYVFLARYIKASVSPDDEMKNMVFFLAELGVMHYQTIISYSPSMIAAAAVYAARCTLNKTPFWTATLKHHTGYLEEQLRECAKVLVGFHSNAAESNLKAVYRKYSKPEFGAVAHLNPAKSF